MLYLFVGLKIPIFLLGAIVWWAVRQTPEPIEPEGGDGGQAACARIARRSSRARRAAARTATRAPLPPPRVAQGDRARPPAGPLAFRAMSAPASVLSDGTIRRLVEEGRVVIDPWDPGDGPARVGRPAPGRLVPRLPQPPRRRDRPARPADQPHRGGRDRGRRAVRHPPGRVRARPHAGVRGDPRRPRLADRGQVEPRPARADRARHGGLRRPRLQGDADARDHQPHARPDQALRRAPDRAALVHDARRARGAARTARPELGSHYQGQTAATESRYGRAVR